MGSGSPVVSPTSTGDACGGPTGELDSTNHIPRADEPAFDSLPHEVREFLATDDIAGTAGEVPPPGVRSTR